MDPILHDLDQPPRDLFASEQGPEKLVPEKLHQADGIRAWDWNKRSIGRNKAVGDQCINANVHLRIVVAVRIPQGQVKAFYPKVRKGLKDLWRQSCVK